MKRVGWKVLLGGGVVVVTSLVAISVPFLQAQPPRGGAQGVESSVSRLMAYDADKDGSLSKTEITDSRLLPMLKRCDANEDGVVSREELTAQLAKEIAAIPPSGNNGGPGGPPPRSGPDARGPMPPGPGQVLPPFIVEELGLTDTQREQLQELQKEVDAKLAKILTPAQLDQLRRPRGRGPGGGPPRPR